MKVRRTAPAAAAIPLAVLIAWWIWALLAVPDHRLVLERQVGLPLSGGGIPARVFFYALPIMALAGFQALRPKIKGWFGAVAAAAFFVILIANSVKCLKLHDPLLSYMTAAMAIAGTALIAAGWLTSGALRRPSSWTVKSLGGGTLMAAGGLELAVILFLVPWSLRGDLPKNWNSYPFGPSLRSILYADLEGYQNHARRNLRGIRLEGADLCGAAFKGADLRGARLDWARMDRADFEGSDLAGAVLKGTRLSFINLKNADLSRVDFRLAYSLGADLRGAVFKGGNPHAFFYADGRGTDLSGTRMNYAQFFGTDLRGAILRNTDIRNANLIRVRFDGADLSGANLACSDMERVTFRGALLAGADLTHARRVRPENLAEARSLRGATIDPALLAELKRLNPSLF